MSAADNPGATAARVTNDWPLIGRAEEWQRVVANLSAGRGVVLAGAAGVGKSRLATDILHVVADEGLGVVRVRATRASSRIPLGAFAPLLPAGIWEVQPSGLGSRASLLRRCADTLVAAARGRTLILSVDDMHDIDNMSATLIYQLVESNAALILGTVRSRMPAPDPTIGLWKNGLADRIELAGLPDDAVAEAIAHALGGPVDDAVVAELAERSRGNILFLRELMRGAFEKKVLRNDGGVWRLVGDLEPTDRLAELVDNRLGDLSHDERALLEVIAFGEPLGAAELAAFGRLDVAESLERKALIATCVEGDRIVVTVSHPLYGDVLRARVPKLRARSIVQSLADAVGTAEVDSGQQILRTATWRMLAGGGDSRLMHEAAMLARWRYDFPLAEQLARAAIEAGAGFESEILLAELVGLQGRPAESEDAFTQLAEKASTSEEMLQVTLSRLDHRVIYVGALEEGLDIARRARSSLGGTARDDVAARMAALIVAKEGFRNAVEATADIIAEGQGTAFVWACMPGSYSLARTGRIDEAVDVARRGREAQLKLTQPMNWYPWMHFFYEVEALSYGGRFDDAEGISTTQYNEAVASRVLEAQALFAWQLSKSVADRGHVDLAVRRAQTATSLYRQLGRPQFVQFCLGYLALALAVSGRASEARATLSALESLDVPASYFMGVDPDLARGWTEVAETRVDLAHRTFEQAARKGVEIGDHVGALAALHSLARTGDPSSAVASMRHIAPHVEGHLAPARLRHVEALVRADATGLDAISVDFEQMGAGLLAAEAAADAAAAWTRANESRSAAAAERRSVLLAVSCGNPRTPALASSKGRASLTASERQAAHLAAAGRTNREIAEELVISVRTVESRLQHVYGKLGIYRRHELAGALTEI